ncbi:MULTISPECIES: CoA pyrophosphatase [Deefgea]|uniref:CoA pyrophosphatase n=1 Tax=Deefgea chitinilytica TaxID=570276 RepID=A0ABS2C8N2_9NEIS|nr:MULTISPECIES: CoA pyrophosphatase [Deefgea]MBM5570498.1 CoA pyrophosphatase [Deefgea chitinilytica]MBM9887727.1 CoA pyrophosphatase [Deefgea sp. CFH1-16]
MLPAVAQLPLWLSERLAKGVRSSGGDYQLNALRAAAVLIPIVLHPTGATVLLTERAAHLNAHAGQVSFPGGAREAQDSNAIATALRETEEEIGLPAECVEVLACLGDYHTISGYCVTPVVGLVQPGFSLQPDPTEVADVFELPLSVLLDRSRYEKRRVSRKGVRGTTHFLECGERVVWGATAGILLNFTLDLDLEGIPKDVTLDG